MLLWLNPLWYLISILDNFPNDINGYNFFKNIYKNELDIMFFESYGFKPELLKMMLDYIPLILVKLY